MKYLCIFASACLDMHNLKRNNLTEPSVCRAINFLLIAVIIRQSSQEERRLKFKPHASHSVGWSSVHREEMGGYDWNISFCDRKERWGFFCCCLVELLFVCFKLRHFMTTWSSCWLQHACLSARTASLLFLNS